MGPAVSPDLVPPVPSTLPRSDSAVPPTEPPPVALSPAAPERSRRARRAGAAIAASLLALLAVGAVPRLVQRRSLHAAVAADAGRIPAVGVAVVRRADATTRFVLPGTVQAAQQTPIYARMDGYVRRWHVDMGARVVAGQLLAEIESPEVDPELRQARARLGQAQAALGLARSTLARYRAMIADSVITRQEFDERVAAHEVARAAASQEEANVQRFVEMRAFQRVTAPFAGVITARNLDVGALVTGGGGIAAGGAGGAVRPLFELAETRTVRVFVNVPQAYAPAVREGQAAELLVREYPGRHFVGRIVRTARVLDSASRTLRTEVMVPNTDGALLAGMYAQVRFSLVRDTPPLLIPAGALVLNDSGPQVVVVGPGDRVRYQPVEIGRDYGATVELVEGVDVGAVVVLNPSDQLRPGSRVRPVHARRAAAGGAQTR